MCLPRFARSGTNNDYRRSLPSRSRWSSCSCNCSVYWCVDDVMEGVNFADVEREFVRGRLYADFVWRVYDTFSPLNPLRAPLSSAQVAFVTTSGAHLSDQAPFDITTAAGIPRSVPSRVRHRWRRSNSLTAATTPDARAPTRMLFCHWTTCVRRRTQGASVD
jgi:hypothetical protein